MHLSLSPERMEVHVTSLVLRETVRPLCAAFYPTHVAISVMIHISHWKLIAISLNKS